MGSTDFMTFTRNVCKQNVIVPKIEKIFFLADQIEKSFGPKMVCSRTLGNTDLEDIQIIRDTLGQWFPRIPTFLHLGNT
jgi:hypothetical protein